MARGLKNRVIYHALLSSMRSGIAVVDRSGTIVVVNDAWNQFAAANGASSPNAIGPGANYLEACRRAAGESAEIAHQVHEGLQTILQGSLEEFTIEYPCHSPCGHSPPVKRWFLLSATPWRLEGGGAIVVHTDITERVQAQQKLKESEQHYRALIENEVDVVTILDADANILFESPALHRILGYQPSELVGCNAFDFVHPADKAAVRQELARVLETNEPSRPIEFGFRHKDGSWRTLESIARNLLANPAVTGIIVNSRDITERRQAEAELRKKEAALQSSHHQLQALTGRLLETEERERRRLSRELHDDLNQKLAALAMDMGSLCSTVSHGQLTAARAQDIPRQLSSLQARVVEMSEEVRSLAYRLHPSVLDDLGLVVALRSYCTEFSQRENLQVTFVHRNVIHPISPNHASCLYRIAQEGLRNVAKHAGARQVLVTLKGSRSHVILKIRDRGAGFRPESARARRGLGLTSMAERARLVGGDFRIVSAPGKGTTLTACVPLEAATET